MMSKLELVARLADGWAGERHVEHRSEPVIGLVRDCSDLGGLIEVRVTARVPGSFRLIAAQAALDPAEQ